MKKVLLGLFVALCLAGCGQVYDREPVGVGYDNNELKLSPCACIMVYQAQYAFHRTNNGGKMLKYPDNFNTPTFPAGPRIALTRTMAICVMVVFALIMVVGGLILWASRSQQIHPFLVSIDKFTGAWQVVGHDHGERTITRNRAMQESVVAKFTSDWFTVSGNNDENNARWNSLADKIECNSDNAPQNSQLYCNSSDDVYMQFSETKIPEYQLRASNGETWSVDVDDIYVHATGDVNDNGGTWRVITEIESNMQQTIPVIIYVTLGRNSEQYPRSMGFYVTGFYAYKTTSEL